MIIVELHGKMLGTRGKENVKSAVATPNKNIVIRVYVCVCVL